MGLTAYAQKILPFIVKSNFMETLKILYYKCFSTSSTIQMICELNNSQICWATTSFNVYTNYQFIIQQKFVSCQIFIQFIAQQWLVPLQKWLKIFPWKCLVQALSTRIDTLISAWSHSAVCWGFLSPIFTVFVPFHFIVLFNYIV